MKNIKRNNENFRGLLFNCIERKSQSFYKVLCLIICFRFLNPQISSPQSRTLHTHTHKLTHILLHSYIITQYTYTDYKHIYFIMIIITFSKSLLNSFLSPFFLPMSFSPLHSIYSLLVLVPYIFLVMACRVSSLLVSSHSFFSIYWRLNQTCFQLTMCDTKTMKTDIIVVTVLSYYVILFLLISITIGFDINIT